MTRKQVYELANSDFIRCPVWEFALDEEGAEGQDEATVRPYLYDGDLDPSLGMFAVRASFTLADGTRVQGYLTPPSPESTDLGTPQPIIITPQGQVVFWQGIIAPTPQQIRESYRRLGKASAAQVFPILFASDVKFLSGPVHGEIPGFLVVEDIHARKVRVVT